MRLNLERIAQLKEAGLTWEEISRAIERKPWSTAYIKNQFYKWAKKQGRGRNE